MNCIRCNIPTARNGYCRSCARTTVGAVEAGELWEVTAASVDETRTWPRVFSPCWREEFQAQSRMTPLVRKRIERCIIATAEAIRRMACRHPPSRLVARHKVGPSGGWVHAHDECGDCGKRQPSQDEPIPYRLNTEQFSRALKVMAKPERELGEEQRSAVGRAIDEQMAKAQREFHRWWYVTSARTDPSLGLVRFVDEEDEP